MDRETLKELVRKLPYFPEFNYKASGMPEGVKVKLETKIRKFNEEKKVWYETPIIKEYYLSSLSEVDFIKLNQWFISDVYKYQVLGVYNREMTVISNLQCTEEFRLISKDPVLKRNYYD